MFDQESRDVDYVVLFPMIFCFPSISRFGFRMHNIIHVYNTWGVLMVLFFSEGGF